MSNEQFEMLMAQLRLLQQAIERISPPFGLPINPHVGGNRCMYCGEWGGHGNLACPKLYPHGQISG